MNIERVIAKFDLKGINYEPSKGSKALMTLEEYLATVGIAWKQSPVGFLVLFVECLNDAQSAKQLFKATMIEANEIMKTWRGAYPDKALNAMCITAIAEAPKGASPSYALGYYDRDNAFYKDWDGIARDRDAWLRHGGFGQEGFEQLAYAKVVHRGAEQQRALLARQERFVIERCGGAFEQLQVRA